MSHGIFWLVVPLWWGILSMWLTSGLCPLRFYLFLMDNINVLSSLYCLSLNPLLDWLTNVVYKHILQTCRLSPSSAGCFLCWTPQSDTISFVCFCFCGLSASVLPIPLLGIYIKRKWNHTSKRCMHSYVYCKTTYSSQHMESQLKCPSTDQQFMGMWWPIYPAKTKNEYCLLQWHEWNWKSLS